MSNQTLGQYFFAMSFSCPDLSCDNSAVIFVLPEVTTEQQIEHSGFPAKMGEIDGHISLAFAALLPQEPWTAISCPACFHGEKCTGGHCWDTFHRHI